MDSISTHSLNVTLFDGDTNLNLQLGGTCPAPAAKKVTFALSEDIPATPAAPAPAQDQESRLESRRVSVSFAVSPAEFYVQELVMAGQLDDLMTRLDTEYAELHEGERAVKTKVGLDGGLGGNG